jgi:exodeoxyribonuclease VII large subunit
MKQAIIEIVEEQKEDVSSLCEDLENAIRDKIDYLKQEINNRDKQLEALNPRRVLSRGYSISQDESGKVVTSIKDIKPGQKVITTVNDGTIHSTVDKVEE